MISPRPQRLQYRISSFVSRLSAFIGVHQRLPRTRMGNQLPIHRSAGPFPVGSCALYQGSACQRVEVLPPPVSGFQPERRATV